MNTNPSSPPRWQDRLTAFVNRRGTTLALVFGALVLLAGLGSTGLWEPWEMDRADLARTLSSPPEVVAAFAKDTTSGGARVAGPAEQALARATAAEGMLLKTPEAGTPTALRATLDLARTRTIAAIVVDGRLLLPDASRPELWRQAGKLSAEAISYAAGASVVIVRDPAQPPAGELARRLAQERWKDVWDSTAGGWGLDAAWDPGKLDEVAATLARETPDPVIVLEAGDAAGLVAALDDGEGAIASRVAFKDSGRTVALPPLETWLRAAAYRIVGPSEWTTRLPGVILALIALWVLLSTVRTIWSTRVALLTGVVLVTLPLFFAQARIIAGEPGMTLALTLIGCGLLLGTLVEPPPAPGQLPRGSGGRPRVARRLVWSYLVAGLVTAVFAKGVFALALGGAIALTLPLVGSEPGIKRRLADWAPAAMFLGAALLLQLIAQAAPAGSVWSALDFESALFSDGPPTYSRTFDMVIKELGFGLAPWSPVVIVAMGLLLFSALENKDKTGLITVAWFFLPIVGLMASLKVGNQFLFAGAGAAAIAVAVMLDKLLRGESGPKYFVAFALVVMFYVMRRELKVSPEPLVGFLAYDPPFAKEGSLRFPETVEIAWVFKQSMIIAALACLVHFGGFARFVVRAARWLRNPRPFLITSGLLLFVASLLGLAVIGRLHGIGMSSRFSGSIQAAQKDLVGRLTGADPIFLVGMATLVVVLGAITVRWLFPQAGHWLRRELPDFTRWPLRRLAWALAAGAWVLAFVVALASVALPADGYLSERLLSLPGLAALTAAAIVGVFVWRVTSAPLDVGGQPIRVVPDAPEKWPWLTPLIAAVATLGLLGTTQLVRDSQLSSPLVTLLVIVGFAGAALAILPRIAGFGTRSEVFIFSVFALLALIVMSFVVPLVDRAGLVTEVTLPETVNPQTYGARTLLQSVWFLGPLLVVVALMVNRAIPRAAASFPDVRLSAHTDRIAALAERGKVLAVVLVVVAFVGVGTHLFKLEPAIAVNVSQKHILDTWRTTAGDNAPIYKHGAFATQGRKDANFYTSGMPEIRDRQAALKVLLGREDQVLEVETATGSDTLLFPGWSDKNDGNGDKRRDATALTGFATAVGDSLLSDATRSWQANSLVGKRLTDAAGRSWLITGNDATSVRVAAEERLSFALVPRARAAYVIDDPRLDATATADVLERRALLLPAEQLSDLNYAFRLLADGRHLPVLDGSSYRVLLTTSWLTADEPQQNRLANATFDDKTFAALKDPRLSRVWGNFEDTVQVVGYATDKSTVTTGEMLKLTVYYKTLKLVKKSLKIFIHLDKSGGGARIAGDHWPLNPTRHTEENKNCGGCYRTDHWLAGDIVKDEYDLEIPEGNTGEYTIWLGLYQPGPDTRLTVKTWDQKRARHDGSNRLGIGTIQVK